MEWWKDFDNSSDIYQVIDSVYEIQYGVDTVSDC